MNSVMPYNPTSFSSAGDVQYKFEVFGVSAIHSWEALALLRMHTQARASSRTSISKPEDLTSKLCQENSTPSIANLPIFDDTLRIFKAVKIQAFKAHQTENEKVVYDGCWK